MAATVKKKAYLITSDDGTWHYAPNEAESPEDAVRLAETEAETEGQLRDISHLRACDAEACRDRHQGHTGSGLRKLFSEALEKECPSLLE